MRIQIIISMSFFLFLAPRIGNTQSLAELLETGQANNLTLKALYKDYLSALEKGAQVSQLPDPEVGIGAFLAPVETRLGGQRARMSASQRLPWFGTRDARADIALTKANALHEKVASTGLEVGYRIKIAYFQLYEFQATQNIIRQNIRILQALRQLALAKVESGKGSTADVLRVDLNIQEQEQELLILDRQLKKPLADLNHILNRPIDSSLVIQDSLPFATLMFRRDTLLSHIRNNHPGIRMVKQQQEASQRVIELNILESKPSFGVGLDYIWVTPRTDAFPSNNGRDILQISGKVSIPIGREQYQAKEREEQLRIAALEDRKLDMESRFLSGIEKAFADHETARLRLALYAKQIATTKAAIQILQTDYSNMGTRFDELLRLEKDLVNYDVKKLRAIVQSQVALASIERYITF